MGKFKLALKDLRTVRVGGQQEAPGLCKHWVGHSEQLSSTWGTPLVQVRLQAAKVAPNDPDLRKKLAECEKEVKRLRFEEALAVPEQEQVLVSSTIDLTAMPVEDSYKGPRMQGTCVNGVAGTGARADEFVRCALTSYVPCWLRGVCEQAATPRATPSRPSLSRPCWTSSRSSASSTGALPLKSSSR